MTEPSAGGRPPALLARVAGGLLILAATLLVALVEAFYVPLRLGTVRLPVSAAIAVACHPALIWGMRAATMSNLAMCTPLALWLAVLLPLSLRRADGDLIITGDNWVATVLLFGGTLLFVGSLAMMLRLGSRRGQAVGR